MLESDDEELLPLSVLMPWTYKEIRSPVRKTTSTKDARMPTSAHKDRSESKIRVGGGLQMPVRDCHCSKDSPARAPRADLGSSKQGKTQSPAKHHDTLQSSSSWIPGSRDIPTLVDTRRYSSSKRRATLVVADSEPEPSDIDENNDLLAHIATKYTKTSSAHAGNAVDNKGPPAPSCNQQPPASNAVNRKSRRVTIIEIPSDSEEEPLPSRSPHSANGNGLQRVISDASVLVEEVSFADNSDEENNEVRSTNTIQSTKTAASYNLEIDSSDSEYDVANGVLVWEPTPNKVKRMQATPRKPLETPLQRIRTPVSNIYSTPSEKARQTIVLGSSDEEYQPYMSKTPIAPLTKRQDVFSKRLANTNSPSKRQSPKKSSFTRERDLLAERLIQELDETVFDNQLPPDLKIVWNGRLNTTAGRASWKKITAPTGQRFFNAEIELSVKVIDNEAKLNCTLAHELCHIGAWAIDKEMKPDHGPAFKAWGRKIMSARKDISVTTKHSYEIDYKYQWQCSNSSCGKVYGRHSKSIDPLKHACGVCSSRLVQLDRNGVPMDQTRATPRKQSEWSVFSKTAFKRIKSENPGLSMTQINQIVAAEWQALKKEKEALSSGLEEALSTLRL